MYVHGSHQMDSDSKPTALNPRSASAQAWPSAISGLTNRSWTALQAQGERFLHNEVSTTRFCLGLLARPNCAWLAACLRIVRNLPLCPPPHLKSNEREANPTANTMEPKRAKANRVSYRVHVQKR